MFVPYRLGLWMMAVFCVIGISVMVATSSKGLQDILYEDLTCEELFFSYNFNINSLDDTIKHYDGCLDYIDPKVSGHTHGELGCNFIREHGLFIQGIVNDIAAVFNIKCADE